METRFLDNPQNVERTVHSPAVSSISSSKSFRLAVIALLIASIGAFYLATIRQGHAWGDDFALYIQEAKDIANGVSYRHSNYIPNPQRADVGPQAYPPIYPLLLSPVYALFGLNLTDMKVENTLFFMAFLFVFFLIVNEELTMPYCVAAIATVGFSPILWDFKDNVLSEITFTFFVYLCLFWALRIFQTNSDQPSFWSAVLLALFIFLSFGTRTLGIALIPALFCSEVVNKKKLPRFSVLVTLLFLIPWFLQRKFSLSESNYMAMLDGHPLGVRGFVSNLDAYLRDLAGFWENGYSNIAHRVLFVVFSGLSAMGYASRFLKRQASIMEFYAPFYILAVLLWPFHSGIRFLIPVLPLYVFYGYLGLSLIRFGRAWKLQNLAFIASILSIALSYAGQYSKANFGPIPGGIGKAETQEFFQYVRGHTEPNAIIVFRKPKALGLFGERQSSAYPPNATDQETWEYIDRIHAAYLVEGPIDELSWHIFLGRNKARLSEVYSNTDFKLYRVIVGASLSPDP